MEKRRRFKGKQGLSQISPIKRMMTIRADQVISIKDFA
jgi:hypothetical protein